MLENKHNLTVDTQSKSIGNAFIEVVQNDNVALEVQIYNNNLLVDNTAYTYTLLSVLPSKERIIRQGEIGPNGYPVFNLGVEEMSETGIILAMVQVYDELGNRVTSYDFKYRMKEDMSTGGVVPSADNPKFVIVEESLLTETISKSDESLFNSQMALENSEQAVTTSNSVQEQFNQVVINGDSSVESAQARVNADGSVTYATLKDRLDTEYEKVTAQFDNLQIGGVNLVQKSNEFNKGAGAVGITSSLMGDGSLQVVSDGTGDWFTVWIKSSDGIEDSFNDGEQFTISFTMKSPDHTKVPEVYIKKGMGYYQLEGTMSSDFNQLSYSGTWVKEGNLSLHLGFLGIVGTTIIKNWKIEKGNKATDWSPSPQDTQNQIDGLGTRLSRLEGKIEELEGRILSLEGV